MPRPVYTADRKIWRDGHLGEGTRLIPEETAIALTYNGGTYAVMMGTPQNLEDFAVGFSLSEGIVTSIDQILSLDVVRLDDGIELRMLLAPDNAARIGERRRHIAGPTGCGICGIDSIAEAVRRLPDSRSCGCGDTLATAIITQSDQVPAQTRQDLAPIIGKYIK